MFYLRGGGNKCTCDLEIIPRHTDREHDISLCFYYLFQRNKDGGREKCLFLLSRPYQKLKFVARRRNKAGERSAIKATFKGWPPACQINTSPKRHIPTISGSSQDDPDPLETHCFKTRLREVVFDWITATFTIVSLP